MHAILYMGRFPEPTGILALLQRLTEEAIFTIVQVQASSTTDAPAKNDEASSVFSSKETSNLYIVHAKGLL